MGEGGSARAAPAPSVEALRAAEAFLAAATAVAIGVFTRRGAVVSANPGMLRLLGLLGRPDWSSRPSRPLDRLLAPPLGELCRRGYAHRGLLHFGDLRDEAHTVRGEVRPLGDGLLIIAEFDVVELERVTSEVSALNSEMANLQRQLSGERAALQRALIELRAAQAQIVHAEKMSALGGFAAGIAHELNNPLAFVTSNVRTLSATLTRLLDGYLALEASAVEGDGQVRERLAWLRRELDLDFVAQDAGDLSRGTLDGLARMRKILEDLRAFLRPGEADLRVADVRACLESTLAIAGPTLRQGNVGVALELGAPTEVRCNPAELGQVFLNLVANAADAVACRARGEGRITIRARAEGGRVAVAFEDNGAGMTPEVQRRVFEPFFTTKPVGEGMGLGLHLAYKIVVDRYGGALTVASTPGAGATFTVTLPGEAIDGR